MPVKALIKQLKKNKNANKSFDKTVEAVKDRTQ